MKKVTFDLTPMIESIIENFSLNNETFSAHQVKLQLRLEMPLYYIDHNVVRSLVHEIMAANKDYELVDNGKFIAYEKIVKLHPILSVTVQQTLNNLPTILDGNDGTSVEDLSSWVGEKCYLKNNEILVLELSSVVYLYRNVPESVYINFRKSSSKGKYFNSNIKGKYERIKLDEAFDCVGVN